MAGMEGVIRPFVGADVTPTPLKPSSPVSAPMVRFVVGARGGTKTFSYSGGSTLTSYMTNVHKEAPPTNFDMTTGKLKT